MTSRNPGKNPGQISFLLCLVGPLAVGVILNALVRPGLAGMLGGVQHSSGHGVRSNDTWWSFDAAVREAHPFLTGFLSQSHGVIAIWTLALTALLLVARWIILRRRRQPSSPVR